MIKKKLKVSVHLQNLNDMSSQMYHHKNKSKLGIVREIFCLPENGLFPGPKSGR